MRHLSTGQRPVGVTVIAILLVLNGLAAIIAGISILSAGGGTGAFLVTLIFGLALLYVAFGLWTLQAWAWLATLALEGIDGLLALLTLLGAPGTFEAWISLIVAAVVIYYLARPEIRSAFHGRPLGI